MRRILTGLFRAFGDRPAGFWFPCVGAAPCSGLKPEALGFFTMEKIPVRYGFCIMAAGAAAGIRDMRRPLPTAGRDSARCGRKSRDGVRRALRGGRASALAGSRACRGGKRGRRDVPNPKYAISFVCAVRFGYLWTFES